MTAEPSERYVHTQDDFWEWKPKFVRRGWRRVLHRLGQGFVVTGILVLLFVAYELWGTNYWTKRAQGRLRNEFREQIAQTPPRATLPTIPGQPAPLPPPEPDAVLLPAEGDALARLIIGKIGVDVIVVEGVDAESLRDGPGHYPGTPFPGDDGNFVLSGHRTTYGAVFHNLDDLREGDRITVETPSGGYDYEVRWSRVVAPTQVDVIDSTAGLKEITLTTCHPKFSASQRLIIRAEQVGGPRPLA